MKLELAGRFLLGVPYQGVVCYGFQVKVLTMGAECTALDMIADLGVDPKSTKASDTMLIEMAYLAQQLEIDGIPNSALTPQFLLENLATDDYTLVLDLIAQLRKKRQDAGEPLNPAVSG